MVEGEDATVDLMEPFNETHSSFETAAALLCGNQSDSFYIPGSRLSYSNGVIGNETGRGVIGSHLNSSYASSSSWDTEPLDLGVPNALTARNDSHGHEIFCNAHYDGVLCWPRTLQGSTAILPCFTEFHGIPYDASRNATRYCHEGGDWDNKTDYSNCNPLSVHSIPSAEGNLEITTGVYFYGYCLSLIALILALIILLVFKELRCLRNTIHTHLIVTYILADALWIITSTTTFTSSGQDSTSQTQPAQSNQVSCVTFIMLHYFHLTNFFWMFVEGFYLYILVVLTFVAENVKLRVYTFVGWGVPLIIVVLWSLAKWMTQSPSSDIQVTDPEFNVSTCLWLTVNIYDWIYKAPVILVLAANMLFLLQIMWVLITKLRSVTNPETKQSRKAAKALLVLMPLLGITYVLILHGSRTPAYEHLRALLISTQGFLVAFLYCFVNHEVRLTIHHEWNRVRNMGLEFACWDCHRQRRMQQMRQFNSSRSASHNTYLSSSPSQKLCHNVAGHMENNSIV